MMSEESYQNEESGNLDEILREYQYFLNSGGRLFLEEEAFEQLIEYFDEREDTSSAMDAVDTALDLYPFSAQLMIKKADLLIASAKYEDALQWLEKAVIYDAGDPNLYILETEAYLALDKPALAIDLIHSALGKFQGKDRENMLFELADVYDDFEDFNKVFDCLREILRISPDNQEALYKICFWTDFTNRFEESIELHQWVIDESPYNKIAWFNLGAAYQGLKLYEKAIDAYKYAVVIDDHFDYAYRNMGDAFLRLKKYNEAIEVLDRVLELTRPEDVIYEAIGHCYHKMGNPAQARFNYRKAVHLSPEDSLLYYKIGRTYMDEKNWTHAVPLLENALRIRKDVAEFNLAMGECQKQLENYDKALNFLEIAVRLRPHSVTSWEAMITCLLVAAQFQSAAQKSLKAYRETSGKTVFKYYYSACLFLQGKPKEALAHLESALTKSPRYLKKFLSLNPAILQNNDVIAMIEQFRKKKAGRL